MPSTSLAAPHLYDRLKKIGWLRSLRYFVTEMREMLVSSPHHEWEETYGRGDDPLHYREERQRFVDALDLLNGVRGNGRFHSVLEVGCAEGMFTASIAPLADRVLAVDFAESALQRASAHLRPFPNVEFRRCDLSRDNLQGQFQVVVVLGVLECIKWWPHVRVAIDKVLGAIEPGGYLLVATTVRAEPVERAWWGRAMLRGTHIHRCLESSPSLQMLRRLRTPCLRGDFEQVLFQRKA